MVIPINDFESDSFTNIVDNNKNNNLQQNLDMVHTDDFTLLIKQGPQASVVAVIAGNMPQGEANQLQKTLEEIHKLYNEELDNVEGDPILFNNSEHQLRDCLMVELKPE